MSEVAAEPAGPPAGRKVLIGYCVAIAIVPFLVIAAGFAIVPSPWFVARAHNTFLANVGYGLELKGADCEVLIYGDSSALAGLDPAIIERRTGLSACNIAETAGVTTVNGTDILDTYLLHNRRPRVILFDFAARNYPPGWESDLFEGMLLRLRQKPDPETALLLLRHPDKVLKFATLGVRTALLNIRREPLPAATYTLRRRHRGYLPVPGDGITACSALVGYPATGAVPIDDRWIAMMRSKYSAGGSIVLATTSPENRCNASYGFYAGRHAATDNRPTLYPLSYFNGSGHQHMTRAGVERFSNEIGDLITARLAAAATPSSATAETR